MNTRSGPARAVALALCAFALFGTASCSDNASKASDASGGAPDRGAVAAAPAAGGTGTEFAGPDTAKGGATATIPPAAVQRAIIYNGSITIRVKDVNLAAESAESLAIGSGGYVGGDDREIDASKSAATLSLRVPSAIFDQTMTTLSKLGTEQHRSVSTQDVTSKLIDVQSRMKTQQASVTRVRALLAQAKSVSEIVAIEGELTQREADLESLESQLRSLTDLTSLSTITVELLGPEAAVVVPPKPAKKGLISGLKSGWHAFETSLDAVLTGLGAVLPFVVLIGLPVWLIVWLVRRRRVPALKAQAASTGPASRQPSSSVPPKATPAGSELETTGPAKAAPPKPTAKPPVKPGPKPEPTAGDDTES